MAALGVAVARGDFMEDLERRQQAEEFLQESADYWSSNGCGSDAILSAFTSKVSGENQFIPLIHIFLYISIKQW
jgi:hypothetical protein